MKYQTKILTCILTAILALSSTGCSILPTIDDGSTPPENTAYVTIGNHLTVHNTDERLTLRSNMDTLSSDGLYYATWSDGEAKDYKNSDGDIIDLYDAQLYLLLAEHQTPDAAQESMNSWLDAGRSNYDITDEGTIRCNDQTYTMIAYNFKNEENPYARGVSAFGVYENCSVCVELTCQETYKEDLLTMLNGFLAGFGYE